MRLNPRFDGAFLIRKVSFTKCAISICLNPRFDGAFLILVVADVIGSELEVLIPDLMGLF